MAEMIPESIAATAGATAGEKRVFRLLRDALLPDDDYLVWYEPKTARRRPDFLLWSQDWGLLVIEVKSWTIDQIRAANANEWAVRYDGIEKTCENPAEQAWQCLRLYKDQIQRSPVLSHGTGPNQGSPRFPLGRCVFFTHISRQQADAKGLLEALPANACLFSDDLDFDTESSEGKRTFVSKLKQSFNLRFSFPPLAAAELTLLRALIFPEVRIAFSPHRLRNERDAALVQALDLQQERTAKSIPEGHRILKGVAGSGKTLVLACRARYLKQLHPKWRILVVCFPVALAQYIRHLIAGSAQTVAATGIDVFHYHALVKALTGASLKRLAAETHDAWEMRVGAMLRDGIIDGSITTRYDAILIDEGQDFTVDWIRSLTSLLNENDSLLLATDPAQNIFGRKTPYIRAGIKVQGKRPVSLTRSYRNTTEILELARQFSGVEKDAIDLEQDPETEAALFPLDSNRHGAPPHIQAGLSEAEQIQFVLDTIARSITAEHCSWGEIGVLCISRSTAEHFVRVFEARFGNGKLYWISESDANKRAFDPAYAVIRLSTIESIKGMEFPLVFLLGIDALPRPDRDEASERKLAYVGLTRAQDLLYILGRERTGVLKELADIAKPSQASTVAPTARA